MQSSQVNVTSQLHCLTEELSVIQMAKDQVCVVFVMLLLSINLFSTVSCFFVQACILGTCLCLYPFWDLARI